MDRGVTLVPLQMVSTLAPLTQPPPKPSTTSSPDIPNLPDKTSSFPLPLATIIAVWIVLGIGYVFARWRQRSRASYIIPRVFVMCSPRTVQFHYEMILRVGMPSAEYNPDKHDIDLTVMGSQRNEVVPMTRLNTKTLLDEPLITSLSMIVYRLVEMPQLGGLVLRHSGPFKAWLYVYDFTVIDLSTNKEMYFTINKYIGQINRVYPLEEHNDNTGVHYPIDDVPLPPWQIEDIFLIMYAVTNCIMLSMSVLPLSCDLSFASDIGSITLASLNGGGVIFFLEWLIYYYARWNADRREYFNLSSESAWISFESFVRIFAGIAATVVGGVAIYYALTITGWHESIVWLLCSSCTCILVLGFWNVARQAELSESISALGLKFKGIESIGVGMRYQDIVADVATKSGSASDEDGHGSTLSSTASKFARSFGPRSSVKSFGFDPITGHPVKGRSQVGYTSTGSTSNEHNSHSKNKR